MYISFFELIPILKDFLVREKPKSLLVISRSSKKYANFIKDILQPLVDEVKITKVLIDAQDSPDFPNQLTLPWGCLTNDEVLPEFDCVFMPDQFDQLPVDSIHKILEKLLKSIKKTALVITPLISEIGPVGNKKYFRPFHSTVFKDFDFSTITVTTIYGRVQIYSFFKQKFEPTRSERTIDSVNNKNSKLAIGYILPHKNLTGGMKCLLEQMRQLRRRGHEVYALIKGNPGDNAIPNWSDVDLDSELSGQFVIKTKEDLAHLSVKFDALMLGFFSQIPDYVGLNTPLVYWEQGYEALYGDYGALLDSENQTLQQYRKIYGSKLNYLAVADVVADVLHSKYGIDAKLLYNGIDHEFYHPLADKKFSSTILLVGNPNLGFKNFPFALRVLNEVWARGGRFSVKWACQTKPNVANLLFPIDFHVMVPQNQLAELYRTSDLFLSTSVYESFPMPPMEAMASGTPVVATDCGGITTYGRNHQNMIIVDQEDVAACANAVLSLLQNESERNRLSQEGLKTAHEFSFTRSIDSLENYFYSVIENRKKS